MNKQLFLMLTAVGLGAIYIFYFTDWTQSKNIQISYRNVVGRGRGPSSIMVFYLDKPHRITSLRVMSAEDAATNKYPHELWHLVAPKGSKPILQFAYARPISGMKSDIPKLSPEPLQPDTRYQIILKDDSGLSGQAIFNTPPKSDNN